MVRKLEEERKAQGLSRRELALRANVTENSIYRYEKGLRVPTAEILLRIAKALKCSAEDLFNG